LTLLLLKVRKADFIKYDVINTDKAGTRALPRKVNFILDLAVRLSNINQEAASRIKIAQEAGSFLG